MRVLFLCRGNVGRSTFGANLYQKYVGMKGVESAGTKLSGGDDTLDDLRPLTNNVIAVMAEENIDVSQHKRKEVTQEMIDEAEVVICMAEPETVPDYVSSHNNFIEWQVDDPKGTDLETHRAIKDDIKERILKTFVEN